MFFSAALPTKQPIDRRLAIVSELDSAPITKPSSRERREATVSELDASSETFVYRHEKRHERTVSELSASNIFWPGDDQGREVHQLRISQGPSHIYSSEQRREAFIAELDVSLAPAVAQNPDHRRRNSIPELEGSLMPVRPCRRFRNHERTTSISDPVIVPQRGSHLSHNPVLPFLEQEQSPDNSGLSKLKRRLRLRSSRSHAPHMDSYPRSLENTKPHQEKIVAYVYGKLNTRDTDDH